MASLLQFIGSASVFAFSFWLSLKILASDSSANKPALAVVIGILCTGAATLGGIFAFGFVMVGLLMILIQVYDLGLVKSFLVVILMFGVQLAIGFLFAAISRPAPGLE